jgi:hypothetical protein
MGCQTLHFVYVTGRIPIPLFTTHLGQRSERLVPDLVLVVRPTACIMWPSLVELDYSFSAIKDNDIGKMSPLVA